MKLLGFVFEYQNGVIGRNITCCSVRIILKLINIFIHWHIGGGESHELYPRYRMRSIDIFFLYPWYGRHMNFDLDKELKGWHRKLLVRVRLPWKYYSA